MEKIIWEMPCNALLFVGPQTEKTLSKYGLHTIGDIARMGLPAMRQMLGKQGETLWVYASGNDDTPVASVGGEAEIKTIGNSTTLPRDITTESQVRCALLDLAETVAARLRKHGMKAGEVQITVRSGDFEEYQRQCRLPLPVSDSQSLYRAALDLYHKENKKWAVRLLGIRAGRLVSSEEAQLSLFASADGQERREQLEAAVDKLRSRYGKGSVSRAMGLEGQQKGKEVR